MFFFFYGLDDAPRYGWQLKRVRETVDAACNVTPDISISTLRSFLTVCERNPELADLKITLGDLAKEMGIPYARLMRHLDILSEGTPSQPGLGLLDKIMDPSARRNRKYKPTAKGDELVRAMMVISDRPVEVTAS